ncbi:MAG: Asp-tRNA(Asn)/Glu-tRNA(Gln) amidotransferase subunit GatA [Candidatus Latescibacteria bacterium]|nr:Asp-tRNA(Asn)/Glu-tRNA(Gln) amidotransferase subunit GatA [Candidatus Latescibacterota bacterium]NIM22132.1 Asp-tRNA(Asn)/Glu-tRNA(Gln) amidotransferase subunit GatA [Candidatus Latescibacterota bacterium]NIM64682.1 Asp-tRNA(Asn)/Glu-tRNA(Gln) amidotransferase subunit GatA [Candidatus Latescibacterota bacterium]NIO01192.1 Asp-tRNA(Asn)/Glu-tRNA(Gln) amidotransferase subunit GatA [Candidatus Latescibacterota bacterium]NIO27577.1 Asp-tRNA(Asn)/Glu-tRNA(Gln) amidotransferase subunit GatA [Candi
MPLNEHGLTELISLLQKKDITPLEIATDLLSAVNDKDKVLHAYLEVYGDELLDVAGRITRDGSFCEKPLCGVPIAVKDNICVEGKKTTCGSRILEDYESPYHATAIEKLIASGAIISGKTNLDEFAMGSSTENSAFGPTRNPWDLERAPGGSSGGSAAAVAAGIAPAALGSDTGGSIRQPAGFCGVVGMKPTYGTVSRYGLVAFASSFDQIGPIAKSVEDCALVLSVITGGDRKDATSTHSLTRDFTRSLEKGLEGLTVGIPKDFLKKNMDAEVEQNFDELLNLLRSHNVPIMDVSLPHSGYAVACYYIIANAEASANLARYDGVRYGYRAAEYDTLDDMYARTRGEGFGEEVQRRILLGTYVLSAGYYDAYYLKAQMVRSLIIRDFESAFEACDLLMMPTSPTPAFKLGEKVADPLLMYLSDIFTVPANLAGLPAISIPSGLSGGGLPLGIQLIGPPCKDETVLAAAYGLEREIGFDRKPNVRS